MSSRRGGLLQFGTLRKLGASATASSSASAIAATVERFWDPSKWYVGIDSPQVPGSAVNYSAAGTADFLYAFPITFDRSGTITALGQHIGNNNGKVWMGIYNSLTASPWLPDTRQFDVEKTSPGFHQPVTATGLAIPIVGGATYWFAGVYNANGVGGGCININLGSQERDQWGTDWDGVTGGVPAINRNVGYRHAFAYAQLPAAFPGGGAPTILKANGAAAPVLMYKFSPT